MIGYNETDTQRELPTAASQPSRQQEPLAGPTRVSSMSPSHISPGTTRKDFGGTPGGTDESNAVPGILQALLHTAPWSELPATAGLSAKGRHSWAQGLSC